MKFSNYFIFYSIVSISPCTTSSKVDKSTAVISSVGHFTWTLGPVVLGAAMVVLGAGVRGAAVVPLVVPVVAFGEMGGLVIYLETIGLLVGEAGRASSGAWMPAISSDYSSFYFTLARMFMAGTLKFYLIFYAFFVKFSLKIFSFCVRFPYNGWVPNSLDPP